MRKEKKANNSTIQGAGVQSYHGGNWSNENYAYEGFNTNRYYTSDRYIVLDHEFKRIDGKPMKAYGLEIEVESTGFRTEKAFATVMRDLIFKLFPEGLFKMQHDGSLGGNGFIGIEAITQCMTKEFIRNHYKDFKTMFNDYFSIFDISATHSGRCGMHVNISNACLGNDEAIRKLYYFINHHFKFACALFNRDSNCTTYCGRMISDKDHVKTMDLTRFSSNHGCSFNLGHYNSGRIEIRLVGGQSNFACFRNTMESVFFLVDRVKKISWDDIDDLAKVFKGCNQYVFDRIKSKCFEAGTITTAQVEAIRPSVKREELL